MPDRRRVGRSVRKLGKPPYLDLADFQRRARLLADLGTIERGKTFSGLLRELLFALIRTYGVVGAVRALRNMNTVQRKLLPELAALDLLAHPPRVTVPVHYVFGEQDALTSVSVVTELPAAIAAPGQHCALCARCRPHGAFRSARHRAKDRGERMKTPRHPDGHGPDQDRAGRRPRTRTATTARSIHRSELDRMASDVCVGHRPSGRRDRRRHGPGDASARHRQVAASLHALGSGVSHRA